MERRLAPYVARTEPRQRALAYLRGLRSPAERTNRWQLAEISGATTPYGFQHLLGRADWEADAVRDELRGSGLDPLRDPDAVLGIDATGFLKKGRHSAGVARHYSGTAGRIANCQLGVFLGYASRLGHTLLDRERYVPKEGIDDRARCRQAGLPNDRGFATTPQRAHQMLARAWGAGCGCGWKPSRRPLCWPSRAKRTSGSAGDTAGSTRS
jgi:SRSO17 transposase